MMPSTVSPRLKGQQGTRRGVGCAVVVTMGMRASGGGEIGGVVVRARDLFLSSSDVVYQAQVDFGRKKLQY